MPDKFAESIEDGVYFQLDAELYHQIPALSASGIKWILVSATDYWYRMPWLNPAYEDDETDSVAKLLGRAYHTRILEGREAFYAAYAETFRAPENAVKTIEEMTEELAKVAINLPSKSKRPDYIAAVRKDCPDVPIFDDLQEAYDELHEGKQYLSAEQIRKIEIAAAMIEHHPENKKLFTGGHPEVTILWTEDGIRFKARLDYLKPKAIIDLKTFANIMGKRVDTAIYGAMASGRYHIQAAFYLRAVEAARRLPAWHGCTIEFRQAVEQCPEHGFYFLMQQKGVAPLARAKKFPRTAMWGCANVSIEEAIRRYKQYTGHFGAEPWVDLEPIGEFQDDQFPAYAVDL